MRQQENQTPEPAFKLSGNNSLLTLPSGETFQLNIDYALLNFFDELPKDVSLSDLKTEILSIQDELMTYIPDDYSHSRYKLMHRLLTANAVFFQLLFSKGGTNGR